MNNGKDLDRAETTCRSATPNKNGLRIHDKVVPKSVENLRRV